MLLQSTLLFFLQEVVSWSKVTANRIMNFRDFLKDYLYEKPQHVFINNFVEFI